KDMWKAFQELKHHDGGMFLVENEELIASVPLKLFGSMSLKSMDELMEEHAKLENALKERGYPHEDPAYSLLFFSSTHLPYVRVTERGIFDVFKKKVLFPAVMR